MRRQFSWDDIAYSLRSGRIPVTKLLIGEAIVAWFFAALTNGTAAFGAAVNAIAFQYPQSLTQPWTFITYPLINGPDPFALLFGCLMLYWFGGSLERAWSSRVYAWFFFIISGITALSISVACFLTGVQAGLLGLWMPLSAITVAWAALNPMQEILLFFVLPVRAKYVGWATAALVAGSFAFSPQYPRPYNLVMAIFGLAGCFAAWRYVHLRSGGGRSRTPVIRLRQSRARRFNPLFWLKDYRERKRLRKLFGEDRRDDRDDRGAWR